MTDPHLPDPEITDEEAAELAAYLDDELPAHRRAAIAARLAGDPALAAAVERRRSAARVIAAAVAETEAPHAVRMRIDALQRRPRRKRRWFFPFAGVLAAAAAAAAALVLVLSGGGLTVPDTLAVALRPPLAAASLDPLQPRLLRENVERVRFPNFAAKFGWRATGTRSDELDGRDTGTVFYEKAGRRIAYTIVAGDALDQPGAARRTLVGGVELRTLRAAGRTVVTWRRQGHTCVLSGAGVEAPALLELAGWKGQGAVKF